MVQESRTREKRGVGGGIGRFFGGIVNFFGGDVDWGYENYVVDVPEIQEYDVEVKDYAMRQYVDLSRFFNEMVLPLFDELGTSTRKLVQQSAKEEEKKLKENFKKSFDELNEKIQEKLEEQKRTLGDQKAFEAELAQNEKNIAWLEEFSAELKDALNS